MTETPSYTIAANLRWFALVYVVSIVVLGLIVGYLQTVGVTLPTTGLGIGLFAGIVAAAGARFSTRRAWTSPDRNLLALGYMAVAATLSCLLAAALVFTDASTLHDLTSGGSFVVMALVVMFVVAVIYFITGRLTLMLIARRVGGNNRENT